MSVAHIILYMCAAVCLLPGAASARAKVAFSQTAPLTTECVVDAARLNDLPLAALIGILAAENGRMGEALRNDNGTWDMGAFQINTIHIKELVEMGITPDAVLRDGRVNASVAAWLLRKELDRTGDIWKAIGAYHSRTPHRRDGYIRQVKSHLTRLQRSGKIELPPLMQGRKGGQ
ncbi:lytic transglycosylase domain-containing protein [Desulfovibrio sp. OttesenSCG-928-G15]|nr:lytic transglycosylase domain-containing protein [Desulfovibrio sp. OttesenSCG-928-G15]